MTGFPPSGDLTVHYVVAGEVFSEWWPTGEGESARLDGGCLVYVDNHGEVTDAISCSALVRVHERDMTCEACRRWGRG